VGEDLPGAGLAGGGGIFREGRLQKELDALGFNLVGFGCGSCIGTPGR
jgi:aconitase A